ncbi:MAG: hypothetical protein R3313_01410 [Candidatus Saccharimonadales bacterium]|nr:hypothetical protein [Candidatus Saccharimonadales bacterium]
MGKKITHQEHKKHVHHVLLYAALITGLMLTVVASIVTFDNRGSSCGVDDETVPFPNSFSSTRVCDGIEEYEFGWPFKQVADEAYWPSILNWAFFSVIVFVIAKAEAHHKGHIPKKPAKK